MNENIKKHNQAFGYLYGIVPHLHKNWTPTKLSYLAGIIDGEGSICIEIQSQSTRWNRKVDYYSLRLLIINTNLPLLEWVQENFGGTIRKRPKVENRRQCYRWNICSIFAAEILKACQKYMIVKKEHTKVFIDFAKTMNKGHYKMSDILLEHRKELYLQLKHINKTY